MATVGSVLSRSPWQALLRQTGRRRARPWLLSCKARWTSNEEQTRPRQLPSVDQDHPWIYSNVGQLLRSIDISSLDGREEHVRLADSKPECLSSWNPASGVRQAIQVPGDASRPRTAGLPLTDSAVHDSVDSPMFAPPSRVASSVSVPRWQSWDDPLASLYHMKPNLRLDDVDIMVNGTALINLMTTASGRMSGSFTAQKKGFAFDIVLMNNTLVFQRRSSSFLTKDAMSTKLQEHSYEAATIPVPGVKNSMYHHQLLRYNIGSLACLVSVEVQGTVQELPAVREHPRPQKTRNVHGIDVITTGQGVLTPLAFQASFRPPDTDPQSALKREAKRLYRRVPRLWIDRQTKLGIVDLIPPGQDAGPGGLTVVELGDKVVRFEEQQQKGLRRLLRLLKVLRDTVRAHGGPCVVVFSKQKGGPLPENHVHVYSAGPEEMPVLLDWHEEHFWSKKNNPDENVQPQDKAINKDARTQKGFFGQWARRLGF